MKKIENKQTILKILENELKETYSEMIKLKQTLNNDYYIQRGKYEEAKHIYSLLVKEYKDTSYEYELETILKELKNIYEIVEDLDDKISKERSRYLDSLPDELDYFTDYPEPEEDYESLCKVSDAMVCGLDDIIYCAEKHLK